MRIVLDTNVLVAGLLSAHGPCGAIVRMASSGELILYLDARVMGEYREVLGRPKFGFDKDRVSALLEQLEHNGEITAAGPLAARLPDSDDEMFLEIAVSARAACLVTGNIAHYPPDLRQEIDVLSPAEFVEFYRSSLVG